MHAPLALRLVAVAFLVGANAFFVAAEFVLVSVRPTRLRQLEQDGHTAARVAIRLHDQIDRVLSATQLGITLASLALGWIGEEAVSELILPVFAGFASGAQLALAHTVAVVIAFLMITVLHVVLGEVVPKNVALGTGNEKLALMIAPPMELFMRISRPFLRVLDVSAAAISHLFGAAPASHRNIHSPDELKMLVTAGIESGMLRESLESIVHSVLDLNKIMVREVMVPRPDIVSVSVDTPFERLLATFVEHQHSRLPVYEGAPENIIGVVHIKDVFRAWVERFDSQKAGRMLRPFLLRRYVRNALIVPETKALDQLLDEFRERRRHMALVVDEFGSITGLVTIVDVLERVVGDFAESPDREERVPRAVGAAIVLDGSTHIRDVEEDYDLQVPHDAGFETLAGFVMTMLGRIPRAGDSLVYKGWRLTVGEMDGYRVASVRMEPMPQEGEVGPARAIS